MTTVLNIRRQYSDMLSVYRERRGRLMRLQKSISHELVLILERRGM
jgi:hypothetical protein